MSEAIPENNPNMISDKQAQAENPFIRGEAGERVEGPLSADLLLQEKKR